MADVKMGFAKQHKVSLVPYKSSKAKAFRKKYGKGFKKKVQTIVKGMSETNYHDFSGIQTTWQKTPGTVQFTLLNGILEADREGNEILPTVLKMKVIYQQLYDGTDYYGSLAHTSYHMIVWINNPQGTAPVDTDIFDTTTTNVYSYAPYNLENRKYFKVLKRWRITPDNLHLYNAYNPAIQNKDCTHATKDIIIKFSDKFKVEYDGNAGTIADIKRGAIYLVSWEGYENDVPNDHNFAYKVHYGGRLFFKDM